MADLEAVLADVSYLMAMEKSKSTPAASASKKIVLPDRSIRSVMHKHLQKMGEHTFDKIFNQQLGFLLFKEFCNQLEEPVPQLKFYEEIKRYEKLESDEERWKVAREIYDNFIMKELLSNSHTYSKKSLDLVQQHLAKCNPNNNKYPLPSNIFEPYKKEICDSLCGRLFDKYAESEKYTRFCQWKNYELTIQLTMNDFSVHRIIGRGGFGEVYGCRKADTGKMYAMKCLDKKRIKMKQGESLALNERMMLTSVSGGDGSPFIVCMSYAFHTTDKLCFILDLMNGGDLHYHLSQHGVFSEKEVKFYAAEILCGLEHMHSRFIVYRDLKPANILLDENGHVRISDLGLACDFSKKKPVASVGTHGYMAPEVLAKNVPYDSSADWFSYGCSLFKLLKGHSPFRQNKTKDRHEVDKLTMTMMIELPDSISGDMRTLLEGLLARDVDKRLGCMGRGVEEVKEHPYFRDVDWKQVYMLKYPPPLVPPRGEVNAADAFDIGNFDEDDTKGIKLTESDQEIYKDFAITISERWQQEIVETVFDSVNAETDKTEAKRKSKMKQTFYDDEKGSDLILQGQLKKNTGTFGLSWQTRYAKLYPNRLELYYENKEKDPEVYTMERIESIESKEVKGQKTISIFLRNGNEPRIVLSPQDIISYKEWQLYISDTFNAYLKRLEPTANYYQSLKLNRLRTATTTTAARLESSDETANSNGGAKIMRHSSRSFSNMGDLLDMVSSRTLLNKPGGGSLVKEKNSNLISLLKSTKPPHRLIYSYHLVKSGGGGGGDLNTSSDNESACTVDLNNNIPASSNNNRGTTAAAGTTQKSVSSSCLRGIISGRHVGRPSWMHHNKQQQPPSIAITTSQSSNNTISSLALAAVHATTVAAASAAISSNDRQLNKMLNNQSERVMSRIAVDGNSSNSNGGRLGNTRASLTTTTDALVPNSRKQSATGSLFSFNNLKSHFHYK